MRQRRPPLVDGTVSRFFVSPPITRRPSTMSPWQTSCPASAAEPLLDRGACRLQASGDSTGGRAWSRMTTTSVPARRVGRPSSSAARTCVCANTLLQGWHRRGEGRINVVPWYRPVGVAKTSSQTQGGRTGLLEEFGYTWQWTVNTWVDSLAQGGGKKKRFSVLLVSLFLE